jgi:hypothetical protein
MRSIVEKQLFKFAMAHNLSEIVRFNNFVRSNLAEHFRTKQGRAFEQSVLENYDNHLACNTFLMAYSYFEEYLFLVWKQRAKRTERARGFSIDRYEPVLKQLGVDRKHPSWAFFEKATAVRHCLLHANGRLSFMKKPSKDQIRAIVRKYPDDLSVKGGDRLVVKVPFTRRVVDEIRAFQGLLPE